MIFEDFDFCSPSVVDRLVGDAALRTMTVVIHGRRYDSFSENLKQGFALDITFQNVTVCYVRKNRFFFVKREIPLLFFVNCERADLFFVKRDLYPPFTTLNLVQGGKSLRDETSASEQKGGMQWTGIELGARSKFKIQRSKFKILITGNQ